MKGKDWKTYKRLLTYVGPYWPLFLISTVGFLIGSGAEAFFVEQFGNLIDSWNKTEIKVLLSIPVLMFLAAVVRGLGEVVGELLLSQVSHSVVHRIRLELFDRLLTMPNSYFDSNSQGHLVSRITFTVTQLRDAGTDALKSIIQDGVKVFVYFGFMLYLTWKLTLIFVATAPIVAIIVIFASQRFRRISRNIQNSMGDVTHVVSEMTSGYGVVKIFGGETYEKKRFFKASNNNRRLNLKMIATKVASTQTIQILVAAALSVLIALLMRPELGGDLSTGTVVTFLGLAGLLARPIKKLSEVNAKLQRGLAAAEDIFTQLDAEVEKDSGTVDVDRVEGLIEFKDVGFTYDKANGEVLKDINLRIEPGETLALVGKSGSGKSTLAGLIPRFYELETGQILIDGKTLHEYSLQALRRQIALVNQQVVLFNDTLENNIAYGSLTNPAASALEDAITRSNSAVFINELPKGLKTIVGDDGLLLSGGQRQRVAIARALLKDAPILILDEATSALDSESERVIQEALEEVMRGRTTLVIAHRLSTVERADRIIVLDQGRIVETGTHEELLAAKGAYSALYEAQFANQMHSPKKRKARKKGPKAKLEKVSAQLESAPMVGSNKLLPAVSTHLGPVERLANVVWYGDGFTSRMLKPVSALYHQQIRRRRHQYQTGERVSWRAPVPVIIVGNITVGGSGKTPLVIWLVKWLKDQGFKPGVVSRGFGRNDDAVASAQPQSDPMCVGDEPVLIARRTHVPVMVGANRVEAVKKLLENHPSTDLVIADDGLQHYDLARDVEILVFDGRRGIGNGKLLPAGPLREPLERSASVDWIVSTGQATGLVADESISRIIPLGFVDVRNHSKRLLCSEFLRDHPRIHLVVGVGNPARVEETLRSLGFRVDVHAWPDHHRFTGKELQFDDDCAVVCTEKDAVKLERIVSTDSQLWYLEIDLNISVEDIEQLKQIFVNRGIKAPVAETQSQ